MNVLKRRLPAVCALVLILSFSLIGCRTLYTDIKMPLPPLSVDPDSQTGIHTGRASCTTYAWMVALGDCSVQAAMEDGNITKVHHVDSEFKSYFLGIYSRFTTVVYGE